MTEAATIPVDEVLFAEVVACHQRVGEARARYNASKADTKDKKEALDHELETFETMFKRLAHRTEGGELPLFANQSEALDAAKSDPVAMKLAERLIHHGHDVNVLIVAGYTEDERNLAAEYLDKLDHNSTADANDDPASRVDVEVPAFLVPQEPTAIDIAALMVRLKDAGTYLDEVAIEELTQVERAEAVDWLNRVDAIKAEKGDALVFEDLPLAPEWLAERAREQAEADGDEQASAPGGDAEENDESDDAIRCQVCGGPDATETTKALNALPKGVLICDDCRQAVKRREVGVARNEDGTLHITDGRSSAEGVH